MVFIFAAHYDYDYNYYNVYANGEQTKIINGHSDAHGEEDEDEGKNDDDEDKDNNDIDPDKNNDNDFPNERTTKTVQW